jgi:16S rRNA (cytidine1402-2'-O)-methyltransferase
MSAIAATLHTFTFFESPHRINHTLTEIGSLLGDRQIELSRELTKLHQEFVRGSIPSVRERLGQPRGEITVVVGPAESIDLSHDQTGEDALSRAVLEFGQLTDAGRSRRAAMTEAARAFDLPVRAVYAAVEKTKKSGI